VTYRWPAFACLVFLITIAYFPGAPSYATAGRWAVAGLGGVWLLWYTPIRVTPAHVWGGLFLLWCAASVFWSVLYYDSIGLLIQYIICAVVFCLAAEERDLTPVYHAVGIGLTISAGVAVFQYFGFVPVRRLSDQIAGLFLGQTWLAEFAMVGLILSLHKDRWQYVPGALFCLVVTVTHAVWAVLALVAVGWLTLQCSWRIRVVVTVLVTAAVFGAFYIQIQEVPRLSSFNDRFVFWQVTVANLSPLGFGLGTYPDVFPIWEHAHNEYLELAAEVGLGSLFLVGVLVYAFKSDDTLPKLALVAILLEALVWYPLHAPTTMLLFAALAGHFSGSYYRRSSVQRDFGVVDGLCFAGEEYPSGATLREAAARGYVLSSGSQHP